MQIKCQTSAGTKMHKCFVGTLLKLFVFTILCTYCVLFIIAKKIHWWYNGIQIFMLFLLFFFVILRLLTYSQVVIFITIIKLCLLYNYKDNKVGTLGSKSKYFQISCCMYLFFF